MKALIIILAVVGLSFLGLLVYGTHRDEQPKKPCERMPGSFNSKDGPSTDELNDWCPPGIAKTTRSLQARFAPGLDLKPPAMLRSSGLEADFQVPSSDKKTRMAKIKLIAGDAAILTDGGDAKLCLCKPGSQIEDRLLTGDSCPASWKRDHTDDAKRGQQRVCQKNDDAGVLPFDQSGGRVVLKPQPSAAVQIQ